MVLVRQGNTRIILSTEEAAKIIGTSTHQSIE